MKGTRWHYQYVIDSAAQEMIELYGVNPDKIESALDLATDYERRIKFQADVQDYVDMSIVLLLIFLSGVVRITMRIQWSLSLNV